MTDHHWILLVLQSFLGMTEERAICHHLVRLRHCAKKVAALKQWTCLTRGKKAAVRWSFSESSVKTETKFIMGDSSNGSGLLDIATAITTERTLSDLRARSRENTKFRTRDLPGFESKAAY